MERVWGGRKLESIYERTLPSGQPYGESWELSDREHEQSIIVGGKFDGLSLNGLWQEHRDEVFGSNMPYTERFPLLIKILDAGRNLSIQVHPPKEKAASLGGDAKNEFWYIADVEPGSKLYVGLKNGVTENSFREAIENGTVDDYVHEIEPKKGDSIYIPSGRLHAIGTGFLIYEIQQNSDTTYRVFDWNRLGLNGQPRQLHVEESLACIDFSDHEPTMDDQNGETLSVCNNFRVDQLHYKAGATISIKNPEQFAVWTIIEGVMKDHEDKLYKKGDFLLAPAYADSLVAIEPVTLLETTLPVL